MKSGFEVSCNLSFAKGIFPGISVFRVESPNAAQHPHLETTMLD